MTQAVGGVDTPSFTPPTGVKKCYWQSPATRSERIG